jgi:hypothetical protein
MVGFVANDGAVRPLSEGFLPDCFEQRGGLAETALKAKGK